MGPRRWKAKDRDTSCGRGGEGEGAGGGRYEKGGGKGGVGRPRSKSTSPVKLICLLIGRGLRLGNMVNLGDICLSSLSLAVSLLASATGITEIPGTSQIRPGAGLWDFSDALNQKSKGRSRAKWFWYACSPRTPRR